MGAVRAWVGRRVGEMGFNAGGGPINWFPGHMAAATRAIRDRLKLSDLVIEVRDARIPLSSVNEDLQSVLSSKRRVIALNKKDLANPNIMHRWIRHFESCKQDCISISAHNRNSVQKEKIKRATVGPLPGVTQDIAGYKIAHRPSIYVLDTPGVLVPCIPNIETGLKLALTGAVKDSVVGEDRLAQYLLAILNTRSTPLHWKYLDNRRMEGSQCESENKNDDLFRDSLPRKKKLLNESDVRHIENLIAEVQRTLYATFLEFDGDLEDESDLESLIEKQFMGLQKAFRIPKKAGDDARTMISKKLLTLFRIGKLGPFTLDNVPNTRDPIA
ncbi:short integuments 2, mitochondrial isoform X3 [Magnolia sinica]|uniref:short integuments 2, mitochondrial isoform X3 n=1 Tax=Magnolia sinica TaxID=86752 RepID=UPI002659FAF0|nr:short integuments 2, mitochondrial isoform X3 [Magnolia sinica]